MSNEKDVESFDQDSEDTNMTVEEEHSGDDDENTSFDESSSSDENQQNAHNERAIQAFNKLSDTLMALAHVTQNFFHTLHENSLNKKEEKSIIPEKLGSDAPKCNKP